MTRVWVVPACVLTERFPSEPRQFQANLLALHDAEAFEHKWQCPFALHEARSGEAAAASRPDLPFQNSSAYTRSTRPWDNP